MIFTRDITFWSGNSLLRPVGSKRERIARNLEAAVSDSMYVSETDVSLQFTQVRRIDDTWRATLDVLPEQAVHCYEEAEPRENVWTGMNECRRIKQVMNANEVNQFSANCIF